MTATPVFDSLFPKQNDRQFVLASIGAMLHGRPLQKHCLLTGLSCSSKTTVVNLVKTLLSASERKFAEPYGPVNLDSGFQYEPFVDFDNDNIEKAS